MRKSIEKKKTITVKVNVTACDLCGNTIINKAYIRISICGIDSNNNQCESDGNVKDICSISCLKHNLKGLELQYAVRDIPAVESVIRERNSNIALRRKSRSMPDLPASALEGGTGRATNCGSVVIL